MFKSYLTIGWRNLIKDKGYSLLNIGGLSLGVAIAILIGLWINDELSFNKAHNNYKSIAAVFQNLTTDGHIDTWSTQSYQLGKALRENYDDYFRHVVMCYPSSAIVAFDEKTFTVKGSFMEEGAPEMLSLKIVHGRSTGLDDPTSILVSQTIARNLFQDKNPIGQVLKFDNTLALKVVGVYEDVSSTSDFVSDLSFIAPLEIEVKRGNRSLGWNNNWLQVYVQLAANTDINKVSQAIKDVKLKNVDEYDKRFQPQLFLHPMEKWHLYSAFENGVNVGGRIEFVWMFGAIGCFVLLLACINFMNLSTARSQKRGKEVGVRKVIGSLRTQLVRQFFTESFIVVALAFSIAIFMVQVSMPLFNEVAAKSIRVDWTNPVLWLIIIGLATAVTFLAGSYPALYLSAFSPITVLKGIHTRGSYASLPRKMLVIVQFTVSVTLIIGTVVIYQQIEHARNRPVGYSLGGLIAVPMKTGEVKANYQGLRNDLLSTNFFSDISASETTVTNLWWSDWGFEWKGKDPTLQDNIFRGAVDYEFGKTVGWKVKEGRDFERGNVSDSSAMILNEAAAKYMGFKEPIGEIVRAYGRTYTVIGVVEDMVTQSLYSPSRQTIFILDPFNSANFINLRISKDAPVAEALSVLSSTFTKHNPNTPFEFRFADDEFADKFAFEARVGSLVGIFAVLAVFISLLGLFGLAAYVAEQRTKEIGIRKVMGASVARLWRLLARDFVVLVVIACFIALPLGYYLMNSWLQDYDYRTSISWWILLLSGAGAVMATVITVSIQTLRAAMVNPVKSLRSE
ncbi:ABC transporter permease [Chryseolinea sp. T2]|uniref:ABC transporter permease n=1 Tax=Chryseolinea sp. T2 TaxID=3129255 RepID=UPI003076B3F6